MKTSRFAAITGGCLCAVVSLISACGSDNTVENGVPEVPAFDGGSDVTVTPNPQPTGDGSVDPSTDAAPDSTVSPDASDAGTDTDAAVDAATDSGTDASDGGSDADADAGPTPVTCGASEWDHDSNPFTACVPWTDCAPGTHVVADGTSSTDRTCTACESGTFTSSSNQPACTAWSNCVAGTYVSTPGSTTTDRACSTCPAGTFADQANQSVCLAQGACPAGTVELSPATSSTAAVCDPCEAGTHCPGGVAPKTACAAGTWDNDLDASTSCVAHTDCVTGQLVSAAGTATTDRTCAPCPSGQFSIASNASSCVAWTNCEPGSYISSPGTALADRVCTACAIGTYASTQNQASCVAAPSCAAGTEQTVAATLRDPPVCVPCAAGEYCAGGATSKVTCSNGNWDPDSDPATPCVSFAASVAQASCDSLSRCCHGSVLPNGGSITSGGTFNRALCESDYSVFGFDYAFDGLSSLTGTPSVTVLNNTAAQNCLTLVSALSCSATGAEITAARTACIAALVGTRALGQSCTRSIECGQGLFCLPSDPTQPTSGGTCATLRTQGQSCNIAFTGNPALPVSDPARYASDYSDSLLAEEACSFRAGGSSSGPWLRCTSWSGVSDYNDRVTPGQEWTCQPTLANGQFCNSSAWCSTGYCDPASSYMCVSPHTYFPASKCSPYTIP
jgi:hypothetical protein